MEALITLISVLFGALISTVLPELFKQQEEKRMRNRRLWEEELERFRQLEELITQLIVETEDAKKAGEVTSFDAEIIRKLRKLQIGFSPLTVPSNAEKIDRFFRELAEFAESGGDLGALIAFSRILIDGCRASLLETEYSSSVKGFSVASLDRLWNRARLSIDFILGRSREK
jgi:hypothetical protein